jgi:hypothetical protein
MLSLLLGSKTKFQALAACLRTSRLPFSGDLGFTPTHYQIAPNHVDVDLGCDNFRLQAFTEHVIY